MTIRRTETHVEENASISVAMITSRFQIYSRNDETRISGFIFDGSALTVHAFLPENRHDLEGN